MSTFIKVTTNIESVVYVNIDHIIAINNELIYLTDSTNIGIKDMKKVLIAITHCNNREIMD